MQGDWWGAGCGQEAGPLMPNADSDTGVGVGICGQVGHRGSKAGFELIEP